MRKDASVCSLLAEDGYDQDLGARSLIATVKQVIEETLVETYLEVDKEIYEGQDMMEYVVNIIKGEVTVLPVPKQLTSDIDQDSDSQLDSDSD
jgi:ATP-dependent Clp protease ATP-binding subunit ClpA